MESIRHASGWRFLWRLFQPDHTTHINDNGKGKAITGNPGADSGDWLFAEGESPVIVVDCHHTCRRQWLFRVTTVFKGHGWIRNRPPGLKFGLAFWAATIFTSKEINSMPMKVCKAVFPAAGLGTRFLPATKAQPKEMLPIVDKPIIQYGVEEALAAGCDQIIIVTGRGKQAIEDHFDVSYELEKMLEERKKTDLLQIVRQISDMIHVAYVRQKEALGLGHAVLMARELVGSEPFAVLLADDVIDSQKPCLKQMMEVFEPTGSSVIATYEVNGPALLQYHVIGGKTVKGNSKLNDRLPSVRHRVETA